MPNEFPQTDAGQFAARLDEAMTEAGHPERGRQAHWTRVFKVSQPTAHAWANGLHKPEPERIRVMAAELGVPFEWLMWGRGAKSRIQEEPVAYGDDDWADVPIYAQQVAAGDGAHPNEDFVSVGSLKFRRGSLRKQGLYEKNLAVFFVRGDSMAPRICDNDSVMFDRSDTTIKDGDVYVIRWQGDFMLKRLLKHSGKIWISSDNKSDPKWAENKPVDLEKDDFEVCGRMVWFAAWRM